MVVDLFAPRRVPARSSGSFRSVPPVLAALVGVVVAANALAVLLHERSTPGPSRDESTPPFSDT